MEYEYEKTFEAGTVTEVNILDRVVTEGGATYIMWGSNLFVDARDTETRVQRKDLPGALKIQRIKSQPVADFQVGDHFVNPQYSAHGYTFQHFKILSLQELDDMFLVECVQVPLVKRFFRSTVTMALVKDEFLYPASAPEETHD